MTESQDRRRRIKYNYKKIQTNINQNTISNLYSFFAVAETQESIINKYLWLSGLYLYEVILFSLFGEMINMSEWHGLDQ